MNGTSVAAQLALEDRIFYIALVAAAVSAFVIWRVGRAYAGRPKPRHLADKRIDARLDVVADYIPMPDETEQAAIRKALLAGASRQLSVRLDEPIPYVLTDRSLPFNVTDLQVRPAAPRCRRYLFRRTVHGGQ